ncbi:hypothetical protein FNH48_00630 [Salmonella enterica subsp. salamae]|nr:hypothetical protein [Salmonella enterica subsp. salamae]
MCGGWHNGRLRLFRRGYESQPDKNASVSVGFMSLMRWNRLSPCKIRLFHLFHLLPLINKTHAKP